MINNSVKTSIEKLTDDLTTKVALQISALVSNPSGASKALDPSGDMTAGSSGGEDPPPPA